MPRIYKNVRRKRKPGPKTFLSKCNSAKNSLKHGLFAKQPQNIAALRDSERVTFDELKAGFGAKTRSQQMLLRKLAAVMAHMSELDHKLDVWSIQEQASRPDAAKLRLLLRHWQRWARFESQLLAELWSRYQKESDAETLSAAAGGQSRCGA